ncbi:EKC/KEOPS complex subunit TPRKB-like [Schistocerca serialis cubense]|uniref:EKC/KEOPS complex subunit TPRKB-like n=1 Tax=Schistocerca serialis cubense TaxID=2023355 RepID=UPI00214EC804|nr:EKC/KEOPS complex subunit TPRKB-like [Schistocerca serialis cubense]
MFREELDQDSGYSIVLFLVENVRNTPELRKLVISGGLECCIVKPSLIVNPFQVVVAGNKAVISMGRGKMSTRNIYTEILYNLSPTKQISQSLIKFGIDDKEDRILVCVLEKCGEKKAEEVLEKIQGDECPIDQLSKFTDVMLVKKTYKINDSECYSSNILDSVVSRISTKEIVV